jgi:hypothetical protein
MFFRIALDFTTAHCVVDSRAMSGLLVMCIPATFDASVEFAQLKLADRFAAPIRAGLMEVWVTGVATQCPRPIAGVRAAVGRHGSAGLGCPPVGLLTSVAIASRSHSLCQRSCRPDRIGTFGGCWNSEMARYGLKFKERVVARLLPPESAPVEEVSNRVGISVATLERWRAEILARPDEERGREWSPAARLEAVIATAAFDETARRAPGAASNGVCPAELDGWKRSGSSTLISRLIGSVPVDAGARRCARGSTASSAVAPALPRSIACWHDCGPTRRTC